MILILQIKLIPVQAWMNIILSIYRAFLKPADVCGGPDTNYNKNNLLSG